MSGLRIYRDAEGDLWAAGEDGRCWFADVRHGDGTWEGPANVFLGYAELDYGPLLELAGTDLDVQLEQLRQLVDRIPARGVR